MYYLCYLMDMEIMYFILLFISSLFLQSSKVSNCEMYKTIIRSVLLLWRLKYMDKILLESLSFIINYYSIVIYCYVLFVCLFFKLTAWHGDIHSFHAKNKNKTKIKQTSKQTNKHKQTTIIYMT